MNWKITRILIILLGGISGVMVAARGFHSQPPLEWKDVLLMMLFTPFALLLIIGVQARNPKSSTQWQKPAWNINPFNFKEPLQFFHLVAFFSIAAGILAVPIEYSLKGRISPDASLLLAIGISLWVGIQLCIYAYRKK